MLNPPPRKSKMKRRCYHEKKKNYSNYLRERHVFTRSQREGEKNTREGSKATDKTGTILTLVSSKNQDAFLARNSVAVAHVVARCTNRCTRRKVNVNAQPTNKKTEKMKKRCHYEKEKTCSNYLRERHVVYSRINSGGKL